MAEIVFRKSLYPRIKCAIRWSNGNVMVFDYDGKQICELQGPYSEELKAQILEAADDETEFEHGAWRDGRIPWPKEMW